MLAAAHWPLRAPASACAVIRIVGNFAAYIFGVPIFTAKTRLKRAGNAIARPDGVAIGPLLTVSSPLRRKDGGQMLQGGL